MTSQPSEYGAATEDAARAHGRAGPKIAEPVADGVVVAPPDPGGFTSAEDSFVFLADARSAEDDVQVAATFDVLAPQDESESAEGAPPTESITMNFEKIRFSPETEMEEFGLF